MAHFAQLDNNNTVLQVIVIDNDIAPDNSSESEAAGQAFIADILKLDGVWKQTSYNTQYAYKYEYDESQPSLMQPSEQKVISTTIVGSEHTLGGTPFRGTFAGIGYTYDADADTFVPPEVLAE